MTWTRLDDNWLADEAFDGLDVPTMWHYLNMIQFCSRGKRYTGVIPLAHARTCSIVDDPLGAIAALIDAGLVENVDGATLRVVRIEEHVPSADLRRKLAQDKVRAARHRKHKAGDHSDCLPENCPASRDASRQSSRDARDSDGDRTGPDVTGSATPLPPDEQALLDEHHSEPPWRDDDPDYTHLHEAS